MTFENGLLSTLGSPLGVRSKMYVPFDGPVAKLVHTYNVDIDVFSITDDLFDIVYSKNCYPHTFFVILFFYTKSII